MTDSNWTQTEETKLAAIELVSALRERALSNVEVFIELQRELRQIARLKMLGERASHTLQPTALVNEAFIKVFKKGPNTTVALDREKMIPVFAHAMGEILNDMADRHATKKRGGNHRQRVPLDENQAIEFADGGDIRGIDPTLMTSPEQSEEILAVREALSLLTEISPRQAEVLQLQYYSGLTQDEIASIIGVSVDLVKLDTRKAKAFLRTRLSRKSR